MGSISDKDFYNQIKGGTTGNLYLLYGEEDFQKGLYRERLIKRVVSEEFKTFNYQKMSGKSFSPKALSEEIERLPVFGDKRITEIVDLKPSSLSDSALKELEEIFSVIPETTIVVFYEQTEELSPKERKSDKKFIELINKYGFSVDFSLKDNPWLIKYLMNGLSKEKIEIDYATAEWIVENSSGEIAFINNEIEKLIAFCKDGKISKEDAEVVCSKSVDASRYDLAKFIISKNIEKALKELDSLLFMKVKPMQILSAISSSFYDMYIVLSAETTKKTDKDIMADFSGYKNRSFVLNAARRNLKSYGKKDMEAALKLISLAEEELKGGKSEDRLILEKLIVKIIKGIDND